MEISVAILAGGRSRRMGCNKALLRLGGATVIERVAAAARPLTTDCFVVADDCGPYRFLGLPAIGDLQKSKGPLGGLQAALHRAAHPALCLLGCDLPFLTTEFLRYLAARLDNHQAVIPRAAGKLQPLCAFYSSTCLSFVETALANDDLRMDAFHPFLEVSYVEQREWQGYDPHGALFANLNSPEDYDLAGALVRRHAL